MTWTPIVGQRFSPVELDAYARSLSFGAWKPTFVVVHNTASPRIVDRPNGFTAQHMQNLVSYYRDQQHWSAGPHAFVDQHGIWLFTPLTSPGVHSPSWNHQAWGIETLGDYDTEAFADPIESNLLDCLTVLHDRLGLDPGSLKLHKEDPLTTHKTCPGKNVDKASLIEGITTRLSARHSSDPVAPNA
jgi:hypothetical protein